MSPQPAAAHLNGMTPTVCSSVHHVGYGADRTAVTCVRTDAPHLSDDVGDHYGWEPMPAGERTFNGAVETWGVWQRLWTWDPSGSAHGHRREGACVDCVGSRTRQSRHDHPASAHRFVECTTCGVLYDTPYDVGQCFGCDLWSKRVEEFGALRAPRHRGDQSGGFLIRPDGSDRLYSWAPGSTDGFGGRRYSGVVRLNDGTEHAFGPADSLWSSGVIPAQFRDLVPHNGVIVGPDGEGAPFD